jgi:microcystin-dependent protein
MDAITVQAALAALQALAPQTGDVVLTYATVAPTGWVMLDDGTIGNAASGATTRANSDCEALFKLLWTIPNSLAPVSGGRGANANADWLANKTIGLCRVLGRALGIAGAGSGLTTRARGAVTGTETVALVAANHAAHTHGQNHHTYRFTYRGTNVESGSDTSVINGIDPTAHGNTIDVVPIGSAGNTNSQGSGTAHANMQPTAFINARIKL